MSKRKAAVGKPHTTSKTPLAAEDVLDKLRDLIRKTHSPIVQQCLREARKEIAYLTATAGPFALDDETYDALSDEEMVASATPAPRRAAALGDVA